MKQGNNYTGYAIVLAKSMIMPYAYKYTHMHTHTYIHAQ